MTIPAIVDEEMPMEAAEVEEEIPPMDDEMIADEMSLPIPEGFKVPMGKKENEPFEVIAKMRMVGDRLMVDSLDGYEPARAVVEEAVPLTDEEEDMEMMDQIGRAVRG